MAKNRNKKKRNGPASMEISEPLVSDAPQELRLVDAAMDTTESGAQDPVCGASIRKLKKGRPMKRSQNVRKMKAIAKAMSKNEKTAQKVFKNESKKNRVQSAKKLYD